jgi:hypothetical protein
VALALATVLVGLLAAVLALPALAGASVRPKLGKYVGTSSTNVVGNHPLQFEMEVTHMKCAAPGGRVKHKTYCVMVSALSLVQTPCPAIEFVDDEFFPATEPIALSGRGTISHTYPLYSGGGGIFDSPANGGTKDGTFRFTLTVDSHGKASGLERFQGNFGEGECDSGAVTIAAKLKK